MTGTAAVCEAFGEAVVFLRYFADLPDPRQRGKVTYPLDEVMLLCLLAVSGGGGDVCRHRPVRREEAGSSAPVPAIHRWHAVARSPR